MRYTMMIGIGLLIAGCGRGKSTDAVVEQLQHPDAARRVEAVQILANRTADADSAVPALAAALRDENAYVRRDAARALGRFGDKAKPAAPALTRLLKDREKSVRKAAEIALHEINPDLVARAGTDKPMPRRR